MGNPLKKIEPWIDPIGNQGQKAIAKYTGLGADPKVVGGGTTPKAPDRTHLYAAPANPYLMGALRSPDGSAPRSTPPLPGGPASNPSAPVSTGAPDGYVPNFFEQQSMGNRPPPTAPGPVVAPGGPPMGHPPIGAPGGPGFHGQPMLPPAGGAPPPGGGPNTFGQPMGPGPGPGMGPGPSPGGPPPPQMLPPSNPNPTGGPANPGMPQTQRIIQMLRQQGAINR